MRLGDMLLKAGVVTELQLNAALAEQERWGGKLGNVLVRMGALSEDLLAMALSRQLNLPRADLDAVTRVPQALQDRLSQATCERYRVLPLAYVHERRAVQLAMSDPLDVVTVDDLRRMLGTRLELFVVGDEALGAAIRRLYGAVTAESVAGNQRGDSALELTDNTGNVKILTSIPTGAPVAGPVVNLSPSLMPTMPPAPAPAPPAHVAGEASFPARVAEHARAVQAVAELLVDRGLAPPDTLRRHS